MANDTRDTNARREGIARTAKDIRGDAVKSGKKDPGHEATERFVKSQIIQAEAKEQRK